MTMLRDQPLSYSEPSLKTEELALSDSEEVAPDAMQLLELANFNGVCRLIAALSQNGVLSPGQIENIHDCMTTPLDDPDWRDDSFVSITRDSLEIVLAEAMREARSKWLKDEPEIY